MNTIDVGYQQRWGKHEQQKVAEQNIGAPQRQFDDLHNKLASRLRHCMRAKSTAIPTTRPPRAVRLLVLELTGEEYRDEDLLDRTLNGDNGNDAEHGMRRIPELEEPLRFRLVVTNCFIR